MSKVNGTEVRGWDSIDGNVDEVELVEPRGAQPMHGYSPNADIQTPFYVVAKARRTINLLDRIKKECVTAPLGAIMEVQCAVPVQALATLNDIAASY
jgi:hypothetical protein